MAKPKTMFVCQACGAQFPKWLGRCTGCDTWGSVVEEVGAPVGGDAVEQNVVVAALDDVDGVDLHVAEMLDRGASGFRAFAERRGGVEALGVEPDAAGLGQAHGDGRPF